MAVGNQGLLGFRPWLPASGAVLDGNLRFLGARRRITADFSNGAASGRASFQTSTANGNTYVQFMPNGTGSQSGFVVFNGSDPDNAGFFLLLQTATAAMLSTSRTGTGVTVPLELQYEGVAKAVVGSYGLAHKGPAVFNVKAYGATGDGTANDTTPLQNAINAAIAVSGEVRIPPGTYSVTTLTVQPADASHRVRILGAGAAATVLVARAGTADALIKIVSPDGSSLVTGYEIADLKISMGTVAQPCLAIDRAHSGSFHDLILGTGTYGLYLSNVGNGHFDRIVFEDTTTTPLYLNGESSGENYYTDCYAYLSAATVNATAGFRVQRTTATDFGGHYFERCAVVRAGSAVCAAGFLFDSSAANTFIGAELTGCIADSIGGPGLRLVNATFCRINGGWYTNATAGQYAVEIDGGYINLIVNAQLTGTGGGVKFIGTTTAALDVGIANCRINSGVAYNLPATRPPQALQLANVNTRLCSSLTNDAPALALASGNTTPADTDYNTALAQRVLVHSGGGGYQCFVLQDAVTGFKNYFRVNAGGGLEILSPSFLLALRMAAEWASATTTYEGLWLNVTDAGSRKDSNLLNLLVNGVSKARCDKQGNFFANSFIGASFKQWWLQTDAGQPTAAETANPARILKVGVSSAAVTVNSATTGSSNVADEGGQYVQYTSATTSGTSKAGVEFPSAAPTTPILIRNWNPIITVVVKTPTDISSQRWMVGFFSADPTGADSTNSIHAMGFRYSTGASDTRWQAVTGDGTTWTTTAPTDTLPAGSGGTVNLTQTGGVVSAAAINAAGSGYPASSSVTLYVSGGSGTGSYLQVSTTAGGALTGTPTVLLGGAGYTSATGAATAAVAPSSVKENTRYILRIDANSGVDVKFYVNNTLIATVSATLPGVAQSLMGVAELRTLAAAGRSLRFGSLRVEHE